MRNFFVALRADLYRLRHGRGGIWILIAVVVLVFLQVAWRKFDTVQRAARDAAQGRASSELESNAFGPFVEGIQTGLVIGVSALVALAAVSMARGRDLGTTRLALVRGFSRAQLFLAGFVGLNLYGLLLFVVVIGTSLASSALFFEFGDLMEEGYVHLESGECVDSVLLALGLAMLPTVAAIASGQLLSVVSSSSSVAVPLALIANHMMAGIGAVSAGAGRCLYASFLPFGSNSWLPECGRYLQGFNDTEFHDAWNWYVPIPAVILFLALGLFLMHRRNL